MFSFDESHGIEFTAITPDLTTTRHSVVGEDLVAVAIGPAATARAGTLYALATGAKHGRLTSFAPDGTTNVVDMDRRPGGLAIAPAGKPNAGTIYFTNSGPEGIGHTATAIDIDGTTEQFEVGQAPAGVVIAPAGTPNAGTVQVVNQGSTEADGSTVTAIAPGGRMTTVAAGPGALQPVIAPAGTVNAGTAYVSNAGSKSSAGNTVTQIRPDGSATTIRTDLMPWYPAIAPTGTPDQGTVHVPYYGGNHASDEDLGKRATVISPTGSNRLIVVDGGGALSGPLVVAPAGTDNAGTVYFVYDHQIRVLGPDGSITSAALPAPDVWTSAERAPPGTSNAGSVYAVSSGLLATDPTSGIVTVIGPDGRARTVPVGAPGSALAIAPPGAVNAGSVFVEYQGGRVSIIAPDDSVRTIDLGTGYASGGAVLVAGGVSRWD